MSRLIIDLEADFELAMRRLAPFPPNPRLAVAVSGGADSSALALLARNWTARKHGSLLALIVDHRIRQNSSVEACLTQERLRGFGVPARIIELSGLGRNRLQETARLARYEALGAAAREAGAVFLLTGHHAADQSETVLMRSRRGKSGLEGMAAWTARTEVVLLRPLLDVEPARLRDFLQQMGLAWVEDPSNMDQRFERVRLRLAGERAMAQDAAQRQDQEKRSGQFLARHVTIRPEGFVIIHAQWAPADVLAALLRAIGGRNYPPKRASVTKIAVRLRPTTLGGVRIMPAGKLGPGWLLVREENRFLGQWDGTNSSAKSSRFRLNEGCLGDFLVDHVEEASAVRLPAAVLASIPSRAIQASHSSSALSKVVFSPPAPVAALPFQPQSAATRR